MLAILAATAFVVAVLPDENEKDEAKITTTVKRLGWISRRALIISFCAHSEV